MLLTVIWNILSKLVPYFHYKEPHLMEFFFMKIKDYRSVAMYFEKQARRFLAMVHLVSYLACIITVYRPLQNLSS